MTMVVRYAMEQTTLPETRQQHRAWPLSLSEIHKIQEQDAKKQLDRGEGI
jgi:hypothetical protein